MSRPEPEPEDPNLPVCRFCGCWIEEPGQQCPALDDGRCQR